MKQRYFTLPWSPRQAFWNTFGLRFNRLAEAAYRRAQR